MNPYFVYVSVSWTLLMRHLFCVYGFSTEFPLVIGAEQIKMIPKETFDNKRFIGTETTIDETLYPDINTTSVQRDKVIRKVRQANPSNINISGGGDGGGGSGTGGDGGELTANVFIKKIKTQQHNLSRSKADSANTNNAIGGFIVNINGGRGGDGRGSGTGGDGGSAITNIVIGKVKNKADKMMHKAEKLKIKTEKKKIRKNRQDDK